MNKSKMNKSKIILQRKIQLFLLNKYFDNNKIYLNKININNNFDNIKQIILNKNFINNFNIFINKLLKYLNIYSYKKISNYNTKKILIIYLIYSNKNIVLHNKTHYNEYMIKYSNKIVNTINELINKKSFETYIKLQFYIQLFINIYNKWEAIDKRINTFNLLIDYYNNNILLMQLDKSSTNYDLFYKNLYDDKVNIYKNVKYMNCKKELEYFNKYKENINHNKYINNELYWINIKYELSKENYDTNLILFLVQKTKNLLEKCIPNNKIILNEINNNIDLEFLEHYLNNDIIDNKYFINLIFYIIEKVQSFQSKSEDAEFNEFVNTLKTNLSNNMKYKDLLPLFFKKIFSKLENIITQKNIFMGLINKNS